MEWILGDCWRCDETSLLVTWVGPAQLDGQHAPIYLCQTCLATVERRALNYFLKRCPDVPADVVMHPYFPPPIPDRPPMSPSQSRQPDRTVPLLEISLSGFGVRASADGRTGREAWRIIRKRHPRVTWAVGAYTLVA